MPRPPSPPPRSDRVKGKGNFDIFRIIDEISLAKKNVPLIDMFDPPDIKIQYKEPLYPYGRCVNLGPALRERKPSIEYFKEHLNDILPFESKIQCAMGRILGQRN